MIHISNLTFSYSKKKTLFDALNLQLQAGHVYGLLGRNGSGKSTLLHLLSGLLCPSSGTLRVIEKDPFLRETGFLSDLMLMPEEFYIPDISISKYVDLYAPFYPKFDKNLFKEILKDFEVNPEENMHKMSMGQRKKAFMSFVLAANTKILLMDEPTNGMDIPSKFQFRKIMKKMDLSNKCVVISTHQVKDLDNLIDSIVILENQRVIFQNDMQLVSDRLSFIVYNEGNQPEEFLYEENGFGGGKVVVENKTGKPTLVDMELLFNAIICDSQVITNVLNRKL